MIPIECPKCGRGGSIPPDRLSARLVCKACHSVFHMDSGGRMVLGEPGTPDNKKQPKARAEASAGSEFDLAQTWNDIPKPVKYGVPAVLVALIAYMYSGGGEDGSQPYQARAEALVRSVLNNNRSATIGFATPSSAEAAGKWFDLMHGQIEQNQIPSSVAINPSLFSGNAEKDSDLTMLVVLSDPTAAAASPVPMTLYMRKEGSSWLFDAQRTLSEAEKEIAAAKAAKPKKK